LRLGLKFIAGIAFALTLMAGASAFAKTPTPTATPTFTPVATSTPSAQQVDVFRGQAWLNGQASAGPITAKIGDIVCSEPSTAITPADSTETIYTVRVLSSDLRPGCGQADALITFFVEGQRASQTAIWQAGGSQFLSLIAGPPFARFFGTSSTSRTRTESIIPFVNDQACGYDRGGGFVDPEHNYEAIVFSNEQQVGCGTEGALITFKILDAQGNIIASANEKGVWHAWDGISDLQRLDLTIGPAGGTKIGNVGTGDGSQEGTSLWGFVAVGLGAAGLTGMAIGTALKRKRVAR